MTAAGVARPAKPARDPAGLRVRELITPEGVDLRLRIGDAGERAAAYILDVIFINVGLIVFAIAAFYAARAANLKLVHLVEVVFTIVSFVVTNGYFMILEMTPRAATLGKRILGLRVAARDGGRLTAEAIFMRNVMREIEVNLPFRFLFVATLGGLFPVIGWLALFGLGWTAIFLFFPLFNRDRMRVGDFVAGTWVVKAPRERLSIDLLDAMEAGAGQFAFTAEQAGAYGVKELYVLEDVLRRRDRQTMTAVAQRIRTKIGWREIADETDAAFLAAYYGALRRRLETQLLFGRRRKDKFDAG